jgi:hypothetical protein
MKKATITFTYDEERLSAVNLFFQTKSLSLESELEGFMDQIYKKNVPAAVREFIEMKGDAPEKKKPARVQTPPRSLIEPDRGDTP